MFTVLTHSLCFMSYAALSALWPVPEWRLFCVWPHNTRTFQRDYLLTAVQIQKGDKSSVKYRGCKDICKAGSNQKGCIVSRRVVVIVSLGTLHVLLHLLLLHSSSEYGFCSLAPTLKQYSCCIKALGCNHYHKNNSKGPFI